MLYISHPKLTQEQLSKKLGLGYSTYRLWLKNYTEKGIQDFISIKYKGTVKSVISDKLHEALEKKVKDSHNPFRGYWEVVLWIRQNFDEHIKYQTVRSYLIRHFGTKLKTPRKSHYKKDQQAIEAFKKNT